MNENQLAELAKQGDKRAFEQLVLLYEKKIYGLALRYLGDEQDALDASQEVFIRVFRFIKGFKNESSFSTWIYKIAVNVCRDMASHRMPLVSLSDDEGETEIADVRFSPETEFEKRELKRLLSEGIKALDEDHRQVIILRDMQNLSYEKIAEILGINVGTVKSRIARGRDKLRRYLIENGNFPEKNESKSSEKEERL